MIRKIADWLARLRAKHPFLFFILVAPPIGFIAFIVFIIIRFSPPRSFYSENACFHHETPDYEAGAAIPFLAMPEPRRLDGLYVNFTANPWIVKNMDAIWLRTDEIWLEGVMYNVQLGGYTISADEIEEIGFSGSELFPGSLYVKAKGDWFRHYQGTISRNCYKLLKEHASELDYADKFKFF